MSRPRSEDPSDDDADQRLETIIAPGGTELDLSGEGRWILNPGSVGQPRDGDARAAYAFYETSGRMDFARVEYNVAAAQKRISAAGLPQSLANRLAIGR